MKSLTTLARGQAIGGVYEVIFYIGEWAFGEMYRVRHKYLGIQVLKLFKENFEQTVDIEEIFHKARVLSKIIHPNVVRVYECSSFHIKDKTLYFLTMGFVSGETLTQLLARRINLSRVEAVNIMIDVLEGLNYVHSLDPSIIHRDINPDNILLFYDENIPRGLLSDFSFTKSLDADKHLCDVTKRYPYMAPECFWGRYILSSDVFSVGVTLYRTITGMHHWQYEFEREDINPTNIVMEICRARKQAPRTISSPSENGDDYLNEILFKAIESDLKKRYRNAYEFLEALKNWRNSLVNESPKALSEASNSEVSSKSYSTKKQDKGFDLVAGMHELKEVLYQDIIRPLSEPELYKKYCVLPPNGMLLYGPPGCGKTYLAQKLAEEIRYHYIEIKPSDLASTYIHGTQEKIGRMFRKAEEKTPTLIFIDEVDAILPSRNIKLDQSFSSEVNEFLAQMSNCADRGIFIVAATNRPENIDPAIMRTGRLDKVFYLSPPDILARQEMLKLYLKNRPIADTIDFTNLAWLMDGYVSSDIKFLVNEAARLALKDQVKICAEHFEVVLKGHQPSVSCEQIRSYEKFSDKRTFFSDN